MSSRQMDGLTKAIPVSRIISPMRLAQKESQAATLVKVLSAEEIMDNISP